MISTSATTHVINWYYTSGRSNTVQSGFEWCPSNTPILSGFWPGQPDNGGNPEHTILFYLDQRSTGRDTILQDYPAWYPMNYMCEVKF
jgi:hypothetical protein